MKQLLFIFLLLIFMPLSAEDFVVEDVSENEINVRHYAADGDLLIIWLVDHDAHRKMFEKMLDAINASGIEIWRVDPLADYFLPRSSENERTLSGDAVAALLEHAHRVSDKTIMVAAYDRMPLPALRGIRLWQQSGQQSAQKYNQKSRLAGAVFFYPNFFGPPPVAGEKPVLDPILEMTNIPVTIYQPETGAQRWRLMEVLEGFWKAGSPTHAYIVPQVRDWFFMGEKDRGSGDKDAADKMPEQLKQFAKVMDAYPKPKSPIAKSGKQFKAAQVKELVKLKKPRLAPGFLLKDQDGEIFKHDDYKGQVLLLNFWATWCPPCVEEIPSMNNLQNRYDEQKFKIVSINYREAQKQLREFSEKIPVDFPVLFDHDGKVSLQWNVFSLPSSFVIDKKGYIRFSANRAIDWDTQTSWNAIDLLLAEPD